jgi:transcriptional regulator with XRE-family HTH domain
MYRRFKEFKEMAMIFGETVRGLREAQGLALRETAHSVGIAPVSLSRIERGKEAPPSEEVVRALAKLLAADAEVLLRLCPVSDKPSDEFRELVKKMRSAQKEYFRTRSRLLLGVAKELEKRVDLHLASGIDQG